MAQASREAQNMGENLQGSAKSLHTKILDRSAVVGILGLGYVGLPLLIEVRRAGFSVLGVDPNEEKVGLLNKGESYIEDVPSSEVAAAFSGEGARAVTSFDHLAEADVILVCVPTPLSKTRDPDFRFISTATEEIAKTLRPGQLVVMESTTYPGTTEELVLPALSRTGLKSGEDFFLAFSPERVDPANKNFTIKNTPKVVGGLGKEGGFLAAELYGSFIDQIHTVSSPKAAEMVKLLENTFRAVNIGLINEIAIICHKLGIDVWEVIEAAKSKPFGFMPFYPGPGLGGHCIPVDPLYLGWKLRTMNYRARFIELADHVNSTMPNYVVFRIAAAMNEFERCVKGAKLLILGAAYKPGVSDVRESPSLSLILQLEALGAKVDYNDPHVPELSLGGVTRTSKEISPEMLASYDLVVLATAHEEYDYPSIAEHSKIVLDTRNGFGTTPASEGNVVRL